MAEKAIYFSSYNEIEKRASFNSEQEISPDNFKCDLSGSHKKRNLPSKTQKWLAWNN